MAKLKPNVEKIFDLRHVIESFMVSKNKFVPELDDKTGLQI